MENKIKYRISIGMSIVLVLIAIVFDGLSLIPLVGTITGPIFWIGVGIYLWMKGIGFLDGKKLAVSALSFIGEMIPFIQELPVLIAGIVSILIIIRIEDKTGLSILKPMSKGITPPKLKNNPLNSQGVRQVRKITRSEESEEPIDVEEQTA